MTTFYNVINGLRHGEERPREAGRVSNHARRRYNEILAQHFIAVSFARDEAVNPNFWLYPIADENHGA